MQTAYVERPGNPRLKYVLLEPDAPARAPVLVTTGFAEHTARYTHVVERWVAAGFVVALYEDPATWSASTTTSTTPRRC